MSGTHFRDTDVGKGSSIYFVHIVLLNDIEFPNTAYGCVDPPSGGFLFYAKRVYFEGLLIN